MCYNIVKNLMEDKAMRLSKSVSKNATSLYVIESTYIHGKRSTRTVESLGTLEKLSKEHEDPIAWAQQYVKSLNEKQALERKKLKENAEVLIRLNASKPIPKNTRVLFNGGYLFLERLYYQLGLDKICETCQADARASYSLSDILARLVFGRILFPGSKHKTFSMMDQFIEPASFELHDVYRALSVLAQNSEFIQSQLYKNSTMVEKRNSRILYYDCTNYYFEIEQEDEFRKYGHSKERRPNPIVQMGLMMDEDGIPLAFNLHPGNTNEQITLTPLEKTIENDFKHSKFVICTDAGLSSAPNKLFNSKKDKAFVTTQSIKTMSEDMQQWALHRDGWKCLGDTNQYSLDDIEKAEAEALQQGQHSAYYGKLFYHEKKDRIEVQDQTAPKGKPKYDYIDQTLYVTFSLKYKEYLRFIRQRQLDKATALAHENLKPVQKSQATNPNDYKRFISSVSTTESGEIANHTTYFVDADIVTQEERYDGFYCVATNLDDPIQTILDINKKRWEIEECFRITKTTFKARPVYLSREDHIRAHFLTCFIALVLYRLLEKKVTTPEQSYTTDEIVEQLRNMNFMASSGNGYIPAYERTTFTDRLHQVFGFRTDFEIVTKKHLKNIQQKIRAN